MKEKKLHSHHWSESITGIQKLIISLLVAICCYVILYMVNIKIGDCLILSWDIFCLALLALSWILFYTTNSDDLCRIVEKQDDGLKLIFAVVSIAIFFSVFGAVFLMLESNESQKYKLLHTFISLSPVLLSWLLLHTMFTIRYAHLYHDHGKLNTGSNVGGLEFPSKEAPEYIDFAYFSFVIGMTFQVSDITISSPAIRRFVLMHSLISFAFNTIIVALSINTIAGLKG